MARSQIVYYSKPCEIYCLGSRTIATKRNNRYFNNLHEAKMSNEATIKITMFKAQITYFRYF